MSARDLPTRAPRSGPAPGQPADVLERVLDKGIVVAGDIQINVLDIELLTIRLRLLIASADKARGLGIDWWEGDAFLSRGANGGGLDKRLRRLERAAGIEPEEVEAGREKDEP